MTDVRRILKYGVRDVESGQLEAAFSTRAAALAYRLRRWHETGREKEVVDT